MTSDELTRNNLSSIFIDLVIFEIQWYTWYQNSFVSWFVNNDFNFKNVDSDVNQSNSNIVTHDRWSDITQQHNKHVNFKTKNMRRQWDFIVMMKAFKKKFLYHFWINSTIKIKFVRDEIEQSIHADVVDDIHVDINYNENNSLFQILDVWKTNFEIKIQNLDQIQLWIIFNEFMMSWSFFFIIVVCNYCDNNIVDFKNLTSKIDDNKTIFYIQCSIL